MKRIALSFFILTLSFTLTKADQLDKGDATLKNIPKPTPPNASTPKAGSTFDISEVCKAYNGSKTLCESTLKSLGGEKAYANPNFIAEKIVRYAQSQFGHTATKAREEMREDDAKVDIKKALSNCVKLYLDICHELRGLFLAVKCRRYEPEAKDFSRMAHAFPWYCEDGLKKAGTSGDKLGLYKNYKDLEDIANILDVVVRYVSPKKTDGSR